jgi:TonB family protein
VELDVRVGKDGSVVDQHVTRSPGHEYAVVAVETVKKWRYRPARCDGYAIGFNITVTIRFSRE